MPITVSYSSIKQYENCGRQYQQVRVLKRFKSEPTDATRYGELVHKAFEEYVRDKKPLPENLSHYLPFVEPLTRIAGDIYCEEKIGLRADFSPCGFFDQDVWLRGIPDFLAVNTSTGIARVCDFKTGKSSRYADTSQLELLAAMIMQHHPEINKVKGALLFVVAGDIVKTDFTRDQLPEILSKWMGKSDAIEAAIENDVWNARPSGLCGFCPVTQDACPHSRK